MATKEFQIKIPKSAIELRIKHEKALQYADGEILTTLSGKIDFISKVSGARISDLKILNPKQINHIWSNCVLTFQGLGGLSEPPKSIILDGKEYEIVDPEKAPIGWHIDFGEAITRKMNETNAPFLASLFFIPKGTTYGETDANDNLLHPIKDRIKIMEEHLPLRTYLEAKAFFLRKCQKSMQESILKRKVTAKTLKVMNPVRRLLGKEPLIQ